MNFEDFKNRYQSKVVNEYPNKVNFKPVVSIMIQTFQHKEFIEDCLRGILSQKTEFPIEILLGEDGSTDGTREICINYADEFPDKIRLFLHHQENKIKVLNTGTGNFNAFYNFFSAKGEFIAFCEGDDLWTDPLKLQKQVDLLKARPDASLTYHSFVEVYDNNVPLPKELVLDQPFQNISAEDLQQLTYHPLLSTVCFKNILNGNLPEEMMEILNVDSFLISLLGNYGAGIFVESIIPSKYRRHNLGVWSNRSKEKKIVSKIRSFRKISKFYLRTENLKMAKFYRKKMRVMLKVLLYKNLKRGRVISTLKILIEMKSEAYMEKAKF